MSEAQRKLCKKIGPETREKIRQGNLGKIVPQEVREKIRNAHMGIRPSPETLEKLRKPKTPEHIEKLRLAWIKRRADKAAKEEEGCPK